MDCQHISDMRAQIMEFLRLWMIGGWIISELRPFVSHKIFFGITPQKACIWGRKQCTLLYPAIMGPPGTSMPPGLPPTQTLPPPPFAQPQGGLHRTSYHMDAPSIQQLICHSIDTHTAVRQYILRSILLDPLYHFFLKINYFFLPSSFFEFTRTRFSSHLSTIYIWNASTSCSIPFQ